LINGRVTIKWLLLGWVTVCGQVNHHRLNSSSRPVLTAISLPYAKAKNSTSYKIKTPDPILIKFGTVD